MKPITFHRNLFSKCDLVSIYAPDGKLIGRTKNPILIDDIRRQIKAAQIYGYYLKFGDDIITLDKDGNFPAHSCLPNCYSLADSILIDLVGF